MPPGVPVAAVGVDNAKNAAALAARIRARDRCSARDGGRRARSPKSKSDLASRTRTSFPLRCSSRSASKSASRCGASSRPQPRWRFSSPRESTHRRLRQRGRVAGPSGRGRAVRDLRPPRRLGLGCRAGSDARRTRPADRRFSVRCSGCSRTNPRARRFYEREGWVADDRRTEVIRGSKRSRCATACPAWSGLALVIARYSRPAMAGVWSEQRKLERWLEVELAATDAWAELGVVPTEAAAEIRKRATAPSPELVREIEERTQHDVAFVDAVSAELGEHGRWFHYGLTSQDVLDTALSLQILEAGALILEGIDRRRPSFAGPRSPGHAADRRTACTRSRPRSVSLAGWAFELDRDRARVERAWRACASASSPARSARTPRPTRRSSASRASGSAWSPHRRRPRSSSAIVMPSCLRRWRRRSVARDVCARDPASRPDGGSRGRGAVRPRAKGSSSMPHKRNPVVSERLCGLARVVRSAAVVGFENVALWHERDISHFSAERIVIPDAFLALDYMPTGSPGSSTASSSFPSGCAATWRRATTLLQPARCSRSSRAALPGRGVPASSSATRCGRRRSRTSASSCARTQ